MSTLSVGDARVRAAISAGFLSSGGVAPTVDELSDLARRNRDDVFDSLRVCDLRGSIALRPGTMDIWLAPPFAAAPTLFRVESGAAHFWASSAWCALGIASLLDRPSIIRSSLGGEAADVAIEMGAGGPPADSPLLVHVAVPAQRWTESLVYAHGTMLFFASNDDVDSWSERHRLPRGVAMPIQQAYALAKAWYAPTTTMEGHQRHRSELQEIFKSVGLDDKFFALKPDRSLV